MHLSAFPRLRPACALLTIVVLQATSLPLEAKTRSGDKLLNQARVAESKQDWDKALDLATRAISQDPADPAYQLELRRVRFEAAAFRITHGQQLRDKDQLADALAEFMRAYEIDPSNDLAQQEIRRTKEMIQRNERMEKQNQKLTPDQAVLTPYEFAKEQTEEKISSMLPVPELRPLNAQPIILKMNNQKPKVLFETLGKLAGVNVLFDPEFDQGVSKPASIDLNGSTLDQSLDYVAIVTHSYWKPLSSNTIFVTQESATKRREFEDEVVRTFYLSNITTPQELQEMSTTLRQVAEITKVFGYASQNALVVRAKAGSMAIAEKIIADLDKPKSEVLVDVMVLEVDSTRSRQLAAAFAPTGINSSILFTPRTSLQTVAGQLTGQTGSSSSSGFSNNGTSGTGTSTGTTGSSTGTGTSGSIVGSIGTTGSTSSSNTNIPIPITNVQYIDGRDYSISNVPGGLLEAILNDTGTRILQRPEIRAVDNFKSVLKIGDRVPTASGSFQPGVGGVGINPLVNTQFTYIDTGVNLEITPRVHPNGEVSLQMDIDISQVKDYVNLGGISQPVIGQRKSTLYVRTRDGQINMLGGLIELQDSKTTSGVPGLANIPIFGRLFSAEQTEKDQTELLITLRPHIVRSPEITEANTKGVYSGNETNIDARFAPRAPTGMDGAADLGPTPTPGPLPVTPLPTAGGPSTTPAGPQAAIGGRVTFSPIHLEAPQGSSFTVNIRADDARNVQSIESHIKFDPKILSLTSIAAGDLLQQNGVQLHPLNNILNNSGDASTTLMRDAAKGSVSGSGTVLTLTFQAIGKGQTVVTMPKLVLRDPAGKEQDANGAPLAVTVK